MEVKISSNNVRSLFNTTLTKIPDDVWEIFRRKTELVTDNKMGLLEMSTPKFGDLAYGFIGLMESGYVIYLDAEGLNSQGDDDAQTFIASLIADAVFGHPEEILTWLVDPDDCPRAVKEALENQGLLLGTDEFVENITASLTDWHESSKRFASRWMLLELADEARRLPLVNEDEDLSIVLAALERVAAKYRIWNGTYRDLVDAYQPEDISEYLNEWGFESIEDALDAWRYEIEEHYSRSDNDQADEEED